MSTEAIQFVLQSAWGKNLSTAHVERVSREVREREVLRGGAICHAGSQVKYWKGVMSGLIKMSVVSDRGRTSTFTGIAAGAWFGEGPVLRADTWDFDGVAMRDTRIALIPKTTFLWLLEESPPFSRYIIQQLNERLAQFTSVIEAERLELPETRVARCLAWLFNPVLYPQVGARLDLTQQEIGYLSGVPRQRVNRALQILEAAGLVETRYGALHVLDLNGLMKFRLNEEHATLIDKLRHRGKNENELPSFAPVVPR
jgi:CRP-like cAMP-binding protein